MKRAPRPGLAVVNTDFEEAVEERDQGLPFRRGEGVRRPAPKRAAGGLAGDC